MFPFFDHKDFLFKIIYNIYYNVCTIYTKHILCIKQNCIYYNIRISLKKIFATIRIIFISLLLQLNLNIQESMIYQSN